MMHFFYLLWRTFLRGQFDPLGHVVPVDIIQSADDGMTIKTMTTYTAKGCILEVHLHLWHGSVSVKSIVTWTRCQEYNNTGGKFRSPFLDH